MEQKGVSSDPNVPVLRAGAQTLQDVQIAKPLDLSKIKSSQDLYDSQKQYELRKTLADYETIPSNIPRGTPQTEEPAARRMGFGQGGGAAQATGYQTITEPTTFTDFAFGRINTPIQETIVEEPKVIEETKTVQPDYSKVIIAAIGIFAVLGFVIWRMKK